MVAKVALQPNIVYDIVASPATPTLMAPVDGFIAAIAGLLLLQVPPVEVVLYVIGEAEQIFGDPVMGFGEGFTVIV